MSVDRGMLAKIHIAKKELGFSDEVYRDILQARYKKGSAAMLTRFEADDLIRHFKTQGFKVRRPAPAVRRNAEGEGGPFAFKSSPTYEEPMARKIVALWITLALAGAVKYSSDSALQAYVKRMTGVDNLAWCDDGQLWKLIEALKKWAKRKGVEI